MGVMVFLCSSTTNPAQMEASPSNSRRMELCPGARANSSCTCPLCTARPEARFSLLCADDQHDRALLLFSVAMIVLLEHLWHVSTPCEVTLCVHTRLAPAARPN